jgi:hypothetical protein
MIDYEVDDRGSIPDSDKVFCTSVSRQVFGALTSLLSNRYRGALSKGIKRVLIQLI